MTRYNYNFNSHFDPGGGNVKFSKILNSSETQKKSFLQALTSAYITDLVKKTGCTYRYKRTDFIGELWLNDRKLTYEFTDYRSHIFDDTFDFRSKTNTNIYGNVMLVIKELDLDSSSISIKFENCIATVLMIHVIEPFVIASMPTNTEIQEPEDLLPDIFGDGNDNCILFGDENDY